MNSKQFLYDPDNRPADFFDEKNRPCVRFSFTDVRSQSSTLQCEKDRQTNPLLFNQEEVANLKIFIDEAINELGTNIAIEEGSLSGAFIQLIIQKNTEGEPYSTALFSRVQKFNLKNTASFILVYALLNQMHLYRM